jgi:hypothetical protein
VTLVGVFDQESHKCHKGGGVSQAVSQGGVSQAVSRDGEAYRGKFITVYNKPRRNESLCSRMNKDRACKYVSLR